MAGPGPADALELVALSQEQNLWEKAWCGFEQVDRAAARKGVMTRRPAVYFAKFGGLRCNVPCS